ncbi:hypothetical protein PR048_010708 [Dryococelus australis]|uniref:Uncharacterized protein n=1 Tax=Dryococelus australis TaxID=614101 RepID=A0ABQ9I3G7_9NEOP|nr:hypothetical protein PR048_010708 [Dryococelus australis]
MCDESQAYRYSAPDTSTTFDGNRSEVQSGSVQYIALDESTTFKSNEENELCEHLKLMAKWGFALTKEEILSVFGDFMSMT